MKKKKILDFLLSVIILFVLVVTYSLGDIYSANNTDPGFNYKKKDWVIGGLGDDIAYGIDIDSHENICVAGAGNGFGAAYYMWVVECLGKVNIELSPMVKVKKKLVKGIVKSFMKRSGEK